MGLNIPKALTLTDMGSERLKRESGAGSMASAPALVRSSCVVYPSGMPLG